MFDEEGSYIENQALGRKVPMRVEIGVYAIEVYVKDLIDGRRPSFFFWAGRAKVTSELARPSKKHGGTRRA